MALVGNKRLGGACFLKVPLIKFGMEEELLKKTKIYVQCLEKEQRVCSPDRWHQ